MHRDSSFCAKSVRYNIFTNGAPYSPTARDLKASCSNIRYDPTGTRTSL